MIVLLFIFAYLFVGFISGAVATAITGNDDDFEWLVPFVIAWPVIIGMVVVIAPFIGLALGAKRTGFFIRRVIHK